MELRYGLNPHQSPSTATPIDSAREPFRFLHGDPSYINVLDAAASWQLVREAANALGRPAAASFKHVSPARSMPSWRRPTGWLRRGRAR